MYRISKTRELFIIFLGLLFPIIIGIYSFNKRIHPISHMLQFTELVQQPDDITCGPASISMLMSYYDKDLTVNEIKKITKTVWYNYDGRDFGMTAPELVRLSLSHYGFRSHLKYGKIDNLKFTIALGKPCIVLIRSGEWNWHYVVVIGFDQEYIYYANPSSGEIEGLSTNEFDNSWNWSFDLHGRECGFWGKFFLKAVEIYPNSYIFVD